MKIKSYSEAGFGPLYPLYLVVAIPLAILANVVAHFKQVYDTKTLGDVVHDSFALNLLWGIFYKFLMFFIAVGVCIVGVGGFCWVIAKIFLE